ncbi:Hypothetical predicted protein [Drosophila guanche]|uniref:Uncharacterized protein n=1 Tax=Drosophila guanche TaxID=7266 RepID=A0A3B0K5E8_DROGU|nr:Hypothetical predicted protein [Drosophila guanche]
MYMNNAFNQIGLQVQNQDRALGQMAEELSRDRKFRSVALMGPPGVGKTMTATALIKNFPWPENVRTYSWNSKESGKDDVSKFRKLREFMHDLSGCGMNLHIIDDLNVDNPEIVPIYNDMMLRRESEGTKDKGTASETVFVVYIFNLKSKDLENQLKYLQKLSPHTKSNQDRALGQMAEELSRDRKFRSVALMGPPGVGKTMTATALIKNFPWPENVRTYSWNSKESGKDDVSKFRKLREFMHDLSGCGMNLHIIDDLNVDNPEIVPIYNDMMLRRESEGTKDKGTASETVFVVYIFNLKSKDLENQLKYLQKLSPHTKSVAFRSFEPKDLKSCLENELKAANYKLSEEARRHPTDSIKR